MTDDDFTDLYGNIELLMFFLPRFSNGFWKCKIREKLLSNNKSEITSVLLFF